MFKEISEELGINCTLISKDWIFMLEKDGVIKFFAGYKSALNDHAVGTVIDDKYALYDVLKNKNKPVSEYNIVYGERVQEDYAIGCNNFEYVRNYFYNHNLDIVLKPNSGTCGRDVYRVRDVNELEELYNKLTKRYFSIIRQLLIKFNSGYFVKRLNDAMYDRVLNNGEQFEYSWKFNLSQGAIASEIVDKELYSRLEGIALDASKTIGLKFGSVDIIYTEEGEALILEMNSGVMLENYIEQFSDGYNNAKALYKDVICEMFRN